MSADPSEVADPNWSESRATCVYHGNYTARSFRGWRPSGCPECSDERELARLERQREEARIADQHRRLDAIGLRGWLCDCTFETFIADSAKQREVRAAARAFAAEIEPDGRGGMWLSGPPGVGKSHLGAAIAKSVVMQRGFSARMLTPRDVVRELRATWKRGAEEDEEDVIQRLGDVDLMVLDEAGIGFGTEAEATQLFEVIDRRSQLCRPTVVLSNLNVESLKAGLGERIFDRLRHGATIHTCNWPSHRRPARSVD